MAGEEEYELIPHKEILELKKELKSMKEGKGGGGKNLQTSIDTLNTTMAGMLDLFHEAAKGMEEEEAEDVSAQLNPLNDKMDVLIEQSKTIAEGLVAIADLMKDIKGKLGALETPRVGPAKPAPAMPPRHAPPAGPPPGLGPGSMPPPGPMPSRTGAPLGPGLDEPPPGPSPGPEPMPEPPL